MVSTPLERIFGEQGVRYTISNSNSPVSEFEKIPSIPPRSLKRNPDVNHVHQTIFQKQRFLIQPLLVLLLDAFVQTLWILFRLVPLLVLLSSLQRDIPRNRPSLSHLHHMVIMEKLSRNVALSAAILIASHLRQPSGIRLINFPLLQNPQCHQ
jgi:hypothetical protein